MQTTRDEASEDDTPVSFAARLREVGTAARGQIEKLLGTKIYLDLRVKVAKNWQSDPKQLGRLGF